MTNDSVWTIEELVALTDEIQTVEMEFRGRPFRIQFCELVEGEEPKLLPLDASASEEEQSDWYQRVGSERILKMIGKAVDKNPDAVEITAEQYGALPATLRYQIISKVLNLEATVKEDFQTG
jgi:hypothetical protein|tara:strand:- start:215 stop:580 length:366 start_codon:yes stop_codon:yes gene_type:complete